MQSDTNKPSLLIKAQARDIEYCHQSREQTPKHTVLITYTVQLQPQASHSFWYKQTILLSKDTVNNNKNNLLWTIVLHNDIYWVCTIFWPVGRTAALCRVSSSWSLSRSPRGKLDQSICHYTLYMVCVCVRVHMWCFLFLLLFASFF